MDGGYAGAHASRVGVPMHMGVHGWPVCRSACEQRRDSHAHWCAWMAGMQERVRAEEGFACAWLCMECGYAGACACRGGVRMRMRVHGWPVCGSVYEQRR
eukprot:76398-Chlamydomonas_euryale.AAC.1